MVGDQNTGVGEQDLKDFRKQGEKLDRALVTGLMFEVIFGNLQFTGGLPNPAPPGEDPSQRQPGRQSGRRVTWTGSAICSFR